MILLLPEGFLLKGILLIALALLAIHTYFGYVRLNRLVNADRESETLLNSLYEAARKDKPAEEQDDEMHALVSQLTEAYNEQTARHEEIDLIRKSIIRHSLMTALIGVVAMAAILFSV